MWNKQTNLLNSEICESGKKRKLQSLQSTLSTSTSAEQPDPSSSTSASGSEYRDRAAERRKAFNQPEKPTWEQLHSISSESNKKRKFAEAPKAPSPATTEQGMEPGKDESNVGNQLLSKMGWKSGTGLGMESDGRVEPIKVQQFAERAGLGASQGFKVGSWTGPAGRKDQAKDVVSLHNLGLHY